MKLGESLGVGSRSESSSEGIGSSLVPESVSGVAEVVEVVVIVVVVVGTIRASSTVVLMVVVTISGFGSAIPGLTSLVFPFVLVS